MKEMIKKIISSIIPDSYLPRSLYQQIEGITEVLSGPFTGMKYIKQSIGSEYYPKILGTYEQELHSILETIPSHNFSKIIDIGAAEGYYAIGLALKNPQSIITAFESELRGRLYLKEMAELNRVSNRILIQGTCDIHTLTHSLLDGEKTFLLVDAEGVEAEILDPIQCPKLKEVYILVEIHDFIHRKIGDTISERFQYTHQIKEVWQTSRQVTHFPFEVSTKQQKFFKKAILELMDERRPERMRWFYMEPTINARVLES